MLQEARLAGPPTEDEQAGQWFSRPGGQQGPAEQEAAIGKYLASSAAGGSAEGAELVAAKQLPDVGTQGLSQKRKAMADFDAW